MEYISAEQKAKELLRSCLNPKELAYFDQWDYLEIQSNYDTTYRIMFGTQTLQLKNDRVQLYCCLQPANGPLPHYDRMLAEYLLIKNDELRYLRMANVMTPPTWRGMQSKRWSLVATFFLIIMIGIMASGIVKLAEWIAR